MQQLDFGMLVGDVNLRITTNNHTGKFKVHGKGQVTNQSGRVEVFTGEPALKFMTPLTDVHTTYTVQVNGKCTLTITATIVQPCMQPADTDEECVDESSGSAGNELAPRAGAVDAGRRAIPPVKDCLRQQQNLVDPGIGESSR